MGVETVHALKDVNFDIFQGEMISIMGASGSGKSTLMNLLGFLDTPTAGELKINGQAISGMSRDRLAGLRNETIGFVFQSFNLLARTSALANVKLPLLYGKHEGVDPTKRAEECLHMVGLSDRMDHHPAQLSGGQQQRVAIARALVSNPKIILADEPTGALDSKTGKEILALFKELNDSGITVILVTHDPDVGAFTNRQLVFKDGHLVKDSANKLEAVS
ncbi:MAG: ABC transporter ATP-binding protein [Kordiimonadaceae bacterium]|nr:ABC transporter ATP-binding protein [Kordiimonadaceae bacterium]